MGNIQGVVGFEIGAKYLRWPSPQDYREAIQNPISSLSDWELKQGELHLDSLQLPLVQSGQYAAVFKISSACKSWAVRCFLHNFSDRHERYRKISDFILRDALEYTVGFELIDKGIKVGSDWFPVLKMEYVDGEPLGRYVRKRLEEPEKIQTIVSRFAEMMAALKHDGIAHGDLQHDNVLVTSDERLRLIDYDGMYVPELAGWHSNELGHRNYQHPARNDMLFGPELDNFSAWVIKGALQCVVEDSSTRQLFRENDESFLLCREDYLLPDHSKTFYELESKHGTCRSFSRRIRTLLKRPATSVPYLNGSVEELQSLPKVELPKPPAKLPEIVDLLTPVHTDSSARISQSATLISRPKVPALLNQYPSRFLQKFVGLEERANYKGLVVKHLEETLRTGESILWSGGLSPLKMSTGQQFYGSRKPINLRYLAIGFILFVASAATVSKVVYLSPFTMLTIVFLAIALSAASGTESNRQMLYALTESGLKICTGSEVMLKNKKYELSVYSFDIPLKAIKQASFFGDTKGEALAERVELLIDTSSTSSGVQGQGLQRLWLHGFTKKDKVSFMTRLRSLGIQCHEVI